MNHTQKPEPMNLLHKREKMIDEMFPLPYRKPEVTLGQIEKAARAMADWDLSDPFSYGRTALHVRQGYLEPAEIIKEMSERTLARRAARRKEVDKEMGRNV